MFPKNLTVFRLDDEHKSINLTDLKTALAKKPFNDCMLNETLSFGFVTPIEDDDRLIIEVMPSVFMFCLQKQNKILPDDVIRDLVAKEIKKLEEKNGYKLPREEVLEVKENLIFKLIPTALPKNTKTFAYLDAKKGWLIIDNASSNKSEDLLKILRSLINGQIDMVDEENADGELTRQSVLKALPLTKIVANNNVSQLLSRWIEYPSMTTEFSAFSFDDECKLQGDDKRTITFKNTLVNSKEVISYIRDGLTVTKLGMTWRDKIAFVLDEKLGIKRVEFLSGVKVDYDDAETPADRFITDAVIATGEITQLLDDLVLAFGGVK